MALDLSGVPDLEYTALKMLTEAEKRQRERGFAVAGGAQPGRAGHGPAVVAGRVLGRERMHFNLEVAVAKYLTSPAAAPLSADRPERGRET